LYEQYYGKIITVPCKINNKDTNRVFNIVKAPGGGSEKKKGKGKKEKVRAKLHVLDITFIMSLACTDLVLLTCILEIRILISRQVYGTQAIGWINRLSGGKCGIGALF